MMNEDHPPVARKVICVDFDGTLFPWGQMYGKAEPFIGAIDFMRKLKREGWTIVIFTSRMSPTWWDAEGFDMKKAYGEQLGYIKSRLDQFGIPYDRITAEKVPAQFYIDDKALTFVNEPGAWGAISKVVFG